MIDARYSSPALDRYVNGSKDFLAYLARVRSEKLQKLLKVLDGTPGLNIDEIADGIGVRRTAANHHIRRLERDGVIIKVRQGRHVLHFPSSVNPIQRTSMCLLRVPSIRSVAEAVFSAPFRSWEELARRLSISTRTLRRAVRKLEHKGLLRVERAAPFGSLVVHLHPELRVVLARAMQPRRPDEVRQAVPVAVAIPAAAAAMAQLLSSVNP